MNRWRVVIILTIAVSTCVVGWLVFSFWRVSPNQRTSIHVGEHLPAPLIKVNVRLGWLVNANSAGEIAAEAQGFYQEEGLEVTFHEGGISNPSVKTVAAGTDDLGFANGPDLVIAARAAEAPLRIVAVIHHEGYHGFFAREDSGILTPYDWPGRRVGVKIGSPTYLYYQAILNKLGIDRAAIREVPLGYDLSPFLGRDVDVLPGAKNNEAIALEMQGIRLVCISPADYGIPTMGNVLFTTEAMLRERADTVRRFVRATMHGWAWCYVPENRDRAIDYLITSNPTLEWARERRALEETLPLIGDGSIDRDKLAKIIANQVRYGDIARPIALEEIIASLPAE